VTRVGRGASTVQKEDVNLSNRVVVIGAPSSAGAYAPGQEKAPAALRTAGLLRLLSDRGITVTDAGDVPGFRWRADKANPRAMNATAVANVARAVADRVEAAFASDAAALVLGGDCTVELGTVAAALRGNQSVGLVYVDLDTDLTTPESTADGALDWMGVAHLLGIEGSLPALVGLGPRQPMLSPDQVLYFSAGNVEPFERKLIQKLGIAEVPLAEVAQDPEGCGRTVAGGWARRFDRLLVHLDVDVLDFGTFPLAENTRRNIGLKFDQLMSAMRPLLAAPNWTALTVTELNPDHGESDGSTVLTFAVALADALANRSGGQPYRRSG
jgi:arginase